MNKYNKVLKIRLNYEESSYWLLKKKKLMESVKKLI